MNHARHCLKHISPKLKDYGEQFKLPRRLYFPNLYGIIGHVQT
jgi:hypothetical protein